MAGGIHNPLLIAQQIEHLMQRDGLAYDAALIAVAQQTGLKLNTVARYHQRLRRDQQRFGSGFSPHDVGGPRGVASSPADPPVASHGGAPPRVEPPPPIPDQIEAALERQDLRSQLTHYKNQAADYRKQLLDQNGFLEALSASIPAFPPVEAPRMRFDAQKTEATACCLWSDHHGNRTISLAETDGYNEFNFEIFCARVWLLCQKMVRLTQIQRGEHNIANLFIPILGDMGNDEHRDENKQSNEFVNARANFRMASVYAQAIRALLRHFQKITLACVPGNEPRMTKEKTAKFQYNNWDWVLYQTIRIALMEDVRKGRVEFVIPLSPSIIVECMGWKFFLAHGDKFKSWAGIPYYGIDRGVNREHKLRRPSKREPHKVDFDYSLFGDKHTFYIIDHGSTIGNGALCGVDEYAKNVLGVTGPATQAMCFIHDKYGCTNWNALDLQDAAGHPFTVSDDLVADLSS